MSSKKHRKKKHAAHSPQERLSAPAGASAPEPATAPGAETQNRGATEGAEAPRRAAGAVGRAAARAGVPASIARRFFAYLIDWYVGALCTAVPISIAAARLTGSIANQYLVDFPAPWGIVTGAAALGAACLYYVAVPLLVWPGQTPGKRLCGIKVVRADGGPVDLPHLALRQIVGMFVVEGVVANASGIWHQMLTIATGVNFVHPLMYAGFALTLASCVMILVRKDRRCLHDLIGGTKVCAA